jgi:hypothetical protein
MTSRFDSLRSLSLPWREAILAVSLLLLWAVVAPLAYGLAGIAGLAAAAASAAVCLAAFSMALALSHVLRDPALATAAVVLAMATRTGIPLLFALATRLHGGVCWEAGAIYYLMVFYLAALAVELPLSLPRQRPVASASQNMV